MKERDKQLHQSEAHVARLIRERTELCAQLTAKTEALEAVTLCLSEREQIFLAIRSDRAALIKTAANIPQTNKTVDAVQSTPDRVPPVAHNELAQLQKEQRRLLRHIDRLETSLNAYETSLSWRLTSPLRWLKSHVAG